jgi:hypothetical protein
VTTHLVTTRLVARCAVAACSVAVAAATVATAVSSAHGPAAERARHAPPAAGTPCTVIGPACAAPDAGDPQRRSAGAGQR